MYCEQHMKRLCVGVCGCVCVCVRERERRGSCHLWAERSALCADTETNKDGEATSCCFLLRPQAQHQTTSDTEQVFTIAGLMLSLRAQKEAAGGGLAILVGLSIST